MTVCDAVAGYAANHSMGFSRPSHCVPHPQTMVRALETLHALGALDGDARLARPYGTQVRVCFLAAALLSCSAAVDAAMLYMLHPHAALPAAKFAVTAVDLPAFLFAPSQMAELPLDPPLARMLLASGQMGCTAEVLTVVAMLRCAC